METILIVEDDGIVAYQMVRVLSKEGYTIPDPVATAEEAIQTAISLRPDMILMDIQLAGEMNGIEAAQHISESIDTCILFLTGFSQTGLVEKAKQIGPYGYLLKPISPKELLATVRTVLFRHKMDLQIKMEKDSLVSMHCELQSQIRAREVDLMITNNLLFKEIEERKQREIMLETAIELSEFITKHSIEDAVLKILDTVEEMTNSSVGFFHILDENYQPTRWHYWSSKTRDSCSILISKKSDEVYHCINIQNIFSNTQNLLVQCVNSLTPQIYTEPELKETFQRLDIPSHLKIHQMLTIPIIRNDHVVAFLGIGNKKDEYNESDIRFTSELINIAWDSLMRKMAENRVAENEQILRMTLNGISDPLLVLDPKGKIIKVNQAMIRYYQLSSDSEIINRFCYELRGNVMPCDGCQRPYYSLVGWRGYFERNSIVYPDRIERLYVDTVRNSSGNIEATIVRISDITQIQHMNQQLIQSEKLASLGILVAGIAHEINNPNNFIVFNIPILKTYFEYLLEIADDFWARQPNLTVFGKSYIEFRKDCFNILKNISHGSQRINQIVSNLRDFVRERGAGSKKPVDIYKLVDQTLSISIGRIKKTVKHFEHYIEPNLPAIVTDPLAIEQILINLLINAVQACDKPESHVSMKIFSVHIPREELVVEVKDNGCGMDESTRQKIFEPFFTTKEIGQGTGLGLSICYRLVQQLEGRIEVQSRVGEGSLFRIAIPLKTHR